MKLGLLSKLLIVIVERRIHETGFTLKVFAAMSAIAGKGAKSVEAEVLEKRNAVNKKGSYFKGPIPWVRL